MQLLNLPTTEEVLNEDSLRVRCINCGHSVILTNDQVGCPHCLTTLRDQLGMLNFTRSSQRNAEQAFYDDVYARTDLAPSAARCSIETVDRLWLLPDAPENAVVREKVGDLSGKSILLLGNGTSVKELAFLQMKPKQLIYSDLSSHALSRIQNSFYLDDYRNCLTFAAIDALDLPFDSQSLDVVYGYAMVHHLSDLDVFFESVVRVLKPDGVAVFMDDAFSPLWHYSKQTWLKALMKASHRRTGISPEDYRFSMSGGFKQNDLAERIRKTGADPWFVRKSFLNYLIYRGAQKFAPRFLNNAIRSASIARAINAIDSALFGLPVLRSNQIRLIWGLQKSDGKQSDCR